MPRPRRRRRVRFRPDVTFFRPEGVKESYLEESILTVDEFEAVRLKDLDGFDQEKAAKKMNISQPTFHRLITSARKKIADAIVKGKAIKIEGGVYRMVGFGRTAGGRGTAAGGGRGMGRGGGRGRMGGFALGPGGECVCASCGHTVSHQRGVPCYQMKCPKCGSPMTRR
jgi:predicted DNA-binding protein (UPF0251 family)